MTPNRNRNASVPALPAPSMEVRGEALERARRLADGLFPHQVEGVAFLLGRRRSILADDMGLGKTRQSILALAESAPDGPWLVVCPASVKRNWEREIQAVRGGDPVAVVGPGAPPHRGWRGWVVVNYDILGRHEAALSALPWGGVVFDEAHYLKNHTSTRSKLARRLVDRVPAAAIHCLTGTPLTNRPRDLFPLLQVVRHPMARSFLSFAKRYCAAEHNGYGWVTDGASNLEDFRVQLHGVLLRRSKDDVLDLPPKLRTWLPVPVAPGTGRREMRRVLELLLSRGQDRTRLLSQLTGARHKLSKAKTTSTIDFVEGAVAQGEKVIVFCSFEEPARTIADHFGEAAVLLTGSTPAAERQSLVDRFQEDEGVRVFVANLVAGGVGITLTAGSQVVFNDLDWVPANHWQAEDRAYRIGQTRTVNVTYMVAENTVDEFVRNALTVKGALIESVIEGKAGELLDGDLFSELERLVGGLSPQVATLADDESGEDPVDRLLREVAQAVEAQEQEAAGQVAGGARRSRLSTQAIQELARVLTGSTVTRYRAASNSKPGAFYTLEEEQGDVACSCPGFNYRGTCSHARTLKGALAAGKKLPAGVVREGG
jgi:SWI/SNF-related matrix-associated actin-dependent regulator of chromatin subfamily A-like protein 1